MVLTTVVIFFLNVVSTFAFDNMTMGHNNDSTTELFNCLSNVTRTYFDRRTIYLHLNALNSNAAIVDSFAKAVQSPKVIMPYSSLFDNSSSQQQLKGVFVFLAEDGLYKQLLNFTQRSYFVAVWTKKASMYNVRQVFRDFWANGKHLNVVGLVAMDNGIVNAYTYRPFSHYGCGKLGRPYLLDQWANAAFQTWVDLFSYKSKTGNMRSCPIKCVGNEHPPDAVMRSGRYGYTVLGVGGKMLEIVASRMNFTPVITSTKSNSNLTEAYSWYSSSDVLDDITAMLYAEEVDLAFGWYSYATRSNNEYNTELAKTTSIDCLGWAVPYRAGPPPRSWTNYVNEFDQFGWLFIGSMFVVVTGYWTFIFLYKVIAQCAILKYAIY